MFLSDFFLIEPQKGREDGKATKGRGERNGEETKKEMIIEEEEKGRKEGRMEKRLWGGERGKGRIRRRR
jgi:hypothetical protein